jgi:holo-[acyl-carrier protein] synthase
MRIAVGIDLVHIPRMARNAQRPSFLDRAFTALEQEQCAGDPARLAGRWAAKEAAMKALGRGLGEIPLTDLEVLRDGSGAPQLLLHGRAGVVGSDQGWTTWTVSVSHDGDYATAVVMALAGAPD